MTLRSRTRRMLALSLSAVVAAAGLAVVPVTAATADSHRLVTLVGDLQSELGCAGDWQPDCAATVLAPTGTDDVYATDFTIPAGTYEYKVAIGGTWDEGYGLDGGDQNIPLRLAGPSDVRVVFDDSTKRVGLELLDVRGDYTAADEDLVAPPVRQPGSDEVFYFVLTDRFQNGDTSNDTGGIAGTRLDHGFDPTDKGFFNGGDIAGLHAELDYIEDLGMTAIWLTPSFKNMPVQGEGADASAGYHGYWVTDFTQIDPHLGTNAELKALIDDANSRGIKVYFDIITNHTADVIDYEEGQYSYIDQETSPYRDANGDVFDPADHSGTGTFPTLDPATSFPYTPFIHPGREDIKVPSWLNDVTLYHNRGDSTWEGESVTYGDFQGLDDLMTEHPTVLDGFIEVYKDWIDFGIDGFRIDTVKHVDFAFWEKWTEEVLAYAHDNGKPDFFMFGEVYDADARLLSPYVRDTDMNSVLDFAFQADVAGYAAGTSWASGLENLFGSDDYYTTADSSASALPTFLGNHDMGRIGYLLRGSDDPLARSVLAHEIMFLTRGQPVVYYGDEQGFAGADPGNDKSARQSMFASQVDEYISQPLLTGEQLGSQDRFDTDAPLYTSIAELAKLRDDHSALSQGAQFELYAEQGLGVYAFSRVDRDDKVEYLVAVNNAAEEKTVDVTTLTSNANFSRLYGTGAASLSSNGDAVASVTVPARGAVVYKADGTVDAKTLELSIEAPAAGAGLSGLAAVSAELGATAWNETTFSWRVAGSDNWNLLGTSESTSPRVFHDVRGIAQGTLIEYRAVSTDAAGNKVAASTYASVGNAVTTTPAEDTGEIDLVTIPGNHGGGMGCSNWAPECENGQLTLREDGVYEGTFDLPAGTYEYKVAIGGSWSVNYGANGVLDGSNLEYTHEGGPITFYFDSVTKQIQNTSDGPIVTLPGAFQSQVGCGGDWAPDCMAAWLTDGDKDGVYEWSTSALAAGTYEVKVAHGLSWDENYGVDGNRDGQNYSFSTSAGKLVSFRYTIETNILEIEVADPPMAGVGQLRAYWLSEDTLAWPTELLGGVDAAELSWSLYHSADASLAIEEGEVTGGESVELEYDAAGLSDDITARFPHLANHVALKTVGLDRDGARQLVTEQLQVLQQLSDGTPSAFTGVQLPGVLDDLYAAELEDVALGAVRGANDVSFSVWAPTAQKVELLTWGADGAGDPTRHAAAFDESNGAWSVNANVVDGAQYLWEVTVYAHSTRKVEVNQVTDPYSHALTTNSTRSVVIDLGDDQWRPALWENTPAPVIEKSVDRAIYELHVRDFSISDTTVPEEERGTYRAFTRDSAGTQQLRQLADAGINTVHLLPTFDIATVNEDRATQQAPACDLASFAPDSDQQQACIGAVADLDGFNWGYDPYHYSTPEGSYAIDPNGGARVSEFREMVGALHATGLQVVLDKVYNHTSQSGQGEKSVLDKVVPGYYHRLNATGGIETSTCCENVATEHQVAQKLMVDSVVTWARDYKVDGFRFDLMGHHSVDNMLAVRAALDELTVERDGIDGSAVYIYGEGWDFGEVSGNVRFQQAIQGQLGGTGIGTFNDRLRDAVHGGSPVDSGSTFRQGYGTGLGYDPNGNAINGTTEQALADLGHQTDLVKIGLAGNLRDFEFVASNGETVRGDELDYNGMPAGYADQPGEVVNYVDAHDNETLYDLAVFKLPTETSMEDRVRMNSLMLGTATLSQGLSFWHAGTELLRSKSLDRDSYNSGDWFNRIDWTGQESTFGAGLPPSGPNSEKWDLMAPLLANPDLKPNAAAIAAAEAQALELLQLRSSLPLLRLGSAELIHEKLSFPAGGTEATPGVIVMAIDDLLGEDVDPAYEGLLVVFNASGAPVTETVADFAGRDFELSAIQAGGADPVVKNTSWDAATGTVTVPARTIAVLVDAQEDGGTEPTDPTDPSDPTDPTDPTAPATVTLSTTKIERGGTLGVEGKGFAAGEVVQIWIESTPQLLLAQVADANGAVSAQVTIPANAELGEHTIRLVGISSDKEAAAGITVVDAHPATGGGLTPEQAVLLALLALAMIGAGYLLVVARLRRSAV